VAFVVEWQVAHLAADGVDEAPGQAPVQVSGEQKEVSGAGPDVRLVGGDPVGLGLFAEAADGFGQAQQAECQAPEGAHGNRAGGAALVQPDDGRATTPHHWHPGSRQLFAGR